MQIANRPIRLILNVDESSVRIYRKDGKISILLPDDIKEIDCQEFAIFPNGDDTNPELVLVSSHRSIGASIVVFPEDICDPLLLWRKGEDPKIQDKEAVTA